MSVPYDLFKDFKFKNNIILEGYRGSISHGVYIKDHIDDKDIFGVYIPSKEFVIGLKQNDHYEKMQGEWDVLYYSLKKFIGLALKGNPNVLSLLWLNNNFYTKNLGEEGQLLIENRDIFTCRNAYHNFIGYAYGQLRRMENMACKGYMGKKRKELVNKFGYDCKNASHAIRLLNMGIEFLVEGRLNVFRRSDKQKLLAIKMGEWTLEQVKQEAERLFNLAQEAYLRCKLPDKPDYEKANKLLIELHNNFWGGGKY